MVKGMTMPRKQRSAIKSVPAVLPVEGLIHMIRGQKVMLDADLAALYEVPTKRLNEAVRRNQDRFPDDFMFQLSKAELDNWRSQIATSNPNVKMGLRRPPYAFTELGVAILSSVLHSARAIHMNIVIMRAFVRMRELIAHHKDLAARVEKLERDHTDTASVIDIIIQDINLIQNPPSGIKRKTLIRIERQAELFCYGLVFCADRSSPVFWIFLSVPDTPQETRRR